MKKLLLILAAIPFFGFTGTPIYTVPTSADLAPYASFPLQNLSVKYQDEQLEVGYDLPISLTGELNHVVFSGQTVDGVPNAVLSGPNGTMNCLRSTAGSATCNVKFENLKTDSAKVNLALQAENLDPAIFGKKQIVSRIFNGDPIGVLQY